MKNGKYREFRDIYRFVYLVYKRRLPVSLEIRAREIAVERARAHFLKKYGSGTPS